tara:strand:+ start:397 stop:939 length:543 start_codon:yes stop_codon:yes gene_type:complete
MKIYTKKGDFGKTSIIGQKGIDKHNIRIEAYGTVDELNSHIGLLRSFSNQKFNRHLKELLFIQNTLFSIGADLASKSPLSNIDSITEIHVKKLEKFIDVLETKLHPLTSFILPGGDIWVSYAHISRSICRRAERRITLLQKTEKINQFIVQFMNRLSDYLFVLARFIHTINKTPEIKWDS